MVKFETPGSDTMAKEQTMMDRRENRRRRVKNGAYAVLPRLWKVGQIEDISQGGLSFSYVPLEESQCEAGLMEIYFANDFFHLKKIPFETVSEFSIDEKTPFSYVERRRYCVKFTSLTAFQKKQIDYFIKNYAQNGTGE